MPLKTGDIILLNYTIWALDEDEERIVDTTLEDVAERHGIKQEGKRYAPLVVVVGRSQLLPAVDKAIQDMEVGQKKVIIAEPKDAYGERSETLVVRLPKKVFTEHGVRVEVGSKVEIAGRRGVVTRVTQRFVTVDFNHPLAGKRLKIELEVARKLDKPEEKLSYLASRWFGIPEEQVSVEYSNGRARVRLPEAVLGLSDLDALLRKFVEEVALYVQEVEKMDLVVEIDLSRPEENAGDEEASEGEEQAAQASS